MTESDNQIDPQARRTLAAIVFTDVAGSAALMERDEDRAMRLIRRDMGLISGICRASGGKVLKNTGDGLLMYFDSAVQAVACSLQSQQTLAIQAQSLPADEVLMHRFGVHLGDVFVSESDVLGDGVNVAARLQAEAEAGGICISQTVYDVVKNRLGVQATYLGPRELKNISEAVPVYQILLDAQGAARPSTARPRGKPRFSASGWIMASVAGLAVCGLIAGLLVLLLRGGSNEDGRESPGWRRQPSSGQGPADLSGGSDAGTEVGSRLATARRGFLTSYKFKEMRTWLERNNLIEGRDDLAQRYERIEKLFQWAESRVKLMASPDDPMVVQIVVPQGVQQIKFYGQDSQLMMDDGQNKREIAFRSIPLGQMAPLIRAAVGRWPLAGDKAQETAESLGYFESECRSLGLIPG